MGRATFLPFAWVPILAHACQNYETQPQIIWLYLICSSFLNQLDYMLTVLASELVRFCRSSDNWCYIWMCLLFCFSSKWFQQSVQVWTLQKIHSIRQACGTSVPPFSLLGLLSQPLVSGVSCLNSSAPHWFVCLKVFPCFLFCTFARTQYNFVLFQKHWRQHIS